MKLFLCLLASFVASTCLSAELPLLNFGPDGVQFELTKSGLRVTVVRDKISVIGKLRIAPGDKRIKLDDSNAIEGVIVGDGGKVNRHFQFGYKKVKSSNEKAIVFDHENGYVNLDGEVDISNLPKGDYTIGIYLIRAQIGGNKRTYLIPETRETEFSAKATLK